jgi:hypothetical protein
MPGRKGQKFTFHSPFETTPGWRDGDRGVFVRLLHPPEVDAEVEDLWEARNQRTGKLGQLWGAEAWKEDGTPAVPEHAFVDWTPDQLVKRKGNRNDKPGRGPVRKTKPNPVAGMAAVDLRAKAAQKRGDR